MPDDPNIQVDDTTVQPLPDIEGNDPAPVDSPSASDFVEFEGVKVPTSAFEKIARERYKQQFEDSENKSKWQGEFTKRDQERAQLERDAEAYRRLQSDQQFKNDRTDPEKAAYIERKKQLFPDIDPRFWDSQYDDIKEAREASFRKSEESRSMEWEQNFLREHPDFKPGSEEYQIMAGLLSMGMEPKKAYERSLWASDNRRKELVDKEFSDRKKAADEEAKRKLIQSRQPGSQGDKPKGDRTNSQIIRDAIDKEMGPQNW